MSDPLLEEYKAYYKRRGERFAGNENYKNSYVAEQNLAEAMLGCDELIEFKDRLGDKNIKCGIALIQDKYAMRKTHFEDIKETVRLEVANEIIEEIVDCTDVMDIVTVVSEIETKGGVKISMDMMNQEFHSEWGRLDLINIYENAEVPDKYKGTLQRWANENRESMVEGNQSLEENNHHWQPGWKHTPEIVMEHRHRRLLPYSDAVVKDQLDMYRKIINR